MLSRSIGRSGSGRGGRRGSGSESGSTGIAEVMGSNPVQA